MSATLIERHENSVTIQIRIPLSRSLLATEEGIQQALNEAGLLATTEALQQFDTDGSPVQIGQARYTTKGQEPKGYQTPYGEAVVARHVYQTSHGGATFCPLERDARIILASTPRFAQIVSHKYAEMAGGRVVADLQANHGRKTSLNVVQRLADAVGSVAQAKEEAWHYATPALDEPVHTIGIGLDGTCMLLVEDGYRQAMVGTISLYDRDGDRVHTIYVAATPEYGKDTFQHRLGREIEHACAFYPRAQRTGVADGASDNWDFLSRYTDDACVDFHHATGYLSGAAKAAHPDSFRKREAWLDDRCHRLKHERGAAAAILAELEGLAGRELRESAREDVEKAISYFRNQGGRMDYARRVRAKLPIGSGVTEAACKTLVKMRLCRSGAKWREEGAAIVLSLRALSYTAGRWEQFWAKIDRYGFPLEN
jgi:hypothetical protein